MPADFVPGVILSSSPLVYISADRTDDPAALAQLIKAVIQAGAVPVTNYFEGGQAEYDWPLYRQLIDRCDAFVILVANTYGQLAVTGESYIHREAVYAKSKSKPLLAFLKNARLDNMPNHELQRLKTLHKLMMKETFKYWSEPGDLLNTAVGLIREKFPADKASSAAMAAAIPKTQAALNADVMARIDTMKNWPMRFSAKVFAHGNCHEVQRQIEMDWQGTFLGLAPLLTSPVSEERMKSLLENFVLERFKGDFQRQIQDAHAVADMRVNDLEFQKLKAYLKGLGLIENVASPGTVLRAYWQLTPEGEKYLNRLLAQ